VWETITVLLEGAFSSPNAPTVLALLVALVALLVCGFVVWRLT
jgi:hypothetical protein